MTFLKILEWLNLTKLFKVRKTTEATPVPPTDHVLRYIRPTAVEDDGTINGSGFLKKPDHKGTSVNWIEYFKGNLECQVDQIRRKARMTYAKTGLLARLNVGIICSHVLEKTANDYDLKIVKDPLEETEEDEEDPSHALIKGTPSINDLQGEYVGDLIVECIIDTFPATPKRT